MVSSIIAVLLQKSGTPQQWVASLFIVAENHL
jgi:hypothetical protein